MRAGKSLIIAGAVAWLIAGVCVMYVTMQANHIMALRADILKAEALKPTVPIINKVPVESSEVEPFAKKLSELYPQLTVTGTGNTISFSAPATDKYGAFREAVGHAFNGGKGWRLSIQSFCVGRECKTPAGLSGVFTIHRLRVDKAAG